MRLHEARTQSSPTRPGEEEIVMERGVRISLTRDEYAGLRVALGRWARIVMAAPAAGYPGDPVLWGLLQRLDAGGGVEVFWAEPAADQQPAGEQPAERPDLGEAGRPRTR